MSEKNLLIYQENVKKAYLYLIKENLNLIKLLLKDKDSLFEPYDLLRDFVLYQSKAKHFQIMSLIGSTAEHLIKIILLKRGFILNEGVTPKKFDNSFLIKLESFNKGPINQEKMNNIYAEAEKSINYSFSDKLIKFDECISLFSTSNDSNYYIGLSSYVMNPHPEVYDKSEYFGYKEIKPENCLRLIQKSRNNYTHLLEAQEEQNGIIWYFINFLIWLSKREFNGFFEEEEYIGSKENQLHFNKNDTTNTNQ